MGHAKVLGDRWTWSDVFYTNHLITDPLRFNRLVEEVRILAIWGKTTLNL